MARGDTKQKIRDATLKLVAQRGFESTPVTAIEVQAGLIPGNGSFYRHYPTKEEALADAVDHEVAAIQSELEQGTLAAKAGSDQVSGGTAERFVADLARLKRMRSLILILARERESVPDIVDTIRKTLVETGLAGYADLVTGGGGHDATAVGVVILSALVGYHLSTEYFDAAPGDVGPEEFAHALAGMLEGRLGDS